jgi:hypothetical protein
LADILAENFGSQADEENASHSRQF